MTAPLLLAGTAGPVLEGGLAVALLLASWRLLRGPTLADRAVALEVAAASVLGLLLLAAVRRDEATFIDVSLLVALVSFVTTLAFARYLTQRSTQ